MKIESSKNVSPLTYTEYKILCVLWKEGRALTSPEIIERISEDREWSPASTITTLNTMIKKGVLKVDGYTRCGRIYGRLFAPVMGQFDYATNEALKFIDNVPKENRIFNLVSALVAKEEVTLETIHNIERMLEEQKKKLTEQ